VEPEARPPQPYTERWPTTYFRNVTPCGFGAICYFCPDSSNIYIHRRRNRKSHTTSKITFHQPTENTLSLHYKDQLYQAVYGISLCLPHHRHGAYKRVL